MNPKKIAFLSLVLTFALTLSSMSFAFPRFDEGMYTPDRIASLTGDVVITSGTLAEQLSGVRRLPDGAARWRWRGALKQCSDSTGEFVRCCLSMKRGAVLRGRPDDVQGGRIAC